MKALLSAYAEEGFAAGRHDFHMGFLILMLAVAACAPAAAQSPTAAPAKPTEAPKPVSAAAPAKPIETPAAKPAASPAAKPAASPAAKPAASPAAKPMGGCWSWSGMKATWSEALNSGTAKVIAQAGKQPHPDLANVQLITKLATNDQQRQLIDAGINLPLDFAQPYALPPGVPPERVQAMREAYLAALRGPEFVAEAKKANFVIAPVTGEQVEQSIKQMFSLSPELRAKLKAVFAP